MKFLCELLFSCLLAAPGAKSIDELSYGTALYAYYQEDYAQALLDVVVAEQQQRRGDDPLRFLLARGSFAFQEGMHRYAADTFAAVDAAELTELDRMRLAFHLARQHYRNGRWDAMEAELARIDLGQTWLGRVRRHPEVSFMRAEAALARTDFSAADAALAPLDGSSAYLAYGLFNLGVAQRAAGDRAAARASFERLGRLEVETEEAWDLVQRGRLALALMARQEGAGVNADELLGSLPGEGRYRDLALASYGRLAMARNDHELAARIWLTLLKRQGWSASHAAAYLGLPISLEGLTSPAHALDRYRDAEGAFEARLAALQSATQRAGDPGWVDALLAAFAQPDDRLRHRRLGSLDLGLGAETWLRWLAGEDLHQVLMEWRELSAMSAWLERLPPRVTAYQEVTRERRRRAAAARALLDDEALLGRRDALAAAVTSQTERLAALREAPPRPDEAWMLPLASDAERALLADLGAKAALVERRMSGAEQARFAARLRRLHGLVFWQIADDRSARLRTLEKALAANRALLDDADARIERLARAESRFAAGVETDFLALTARADAVAERVDRALNGRRAVIVQALERGLEREVAETRRYLLAARIAVARATDQLATASPAHDGSAAGGGDDS